MVLGKPVGMKYGRGGTSRLRREWDAICPLHALMLTAWRLPR